MTEVAIYNPSSRIYDQLEIFEVYGPLGKSYAEVFKPLQIAHITCYFRLFREELEFQKYEVIWRVVCVAAQETLDFVLKKCSNFVCVFPEYGFTFVQQAQSLEDVVWQIFQESINNFI